MYKKVVQKAFAKAQLEIPGKTTKTNISEHISMVLLNEFKSQISGRTLRNLIDESYRIEESEDISINSEHVQILCSYLGFKNYNDYLEKNPSEVKASSPLMTFLKQQWIILTICLSTLIIVFTMVTYNKQKWMVWIDTKYVEVDFSEEKYNLNVLKLYNETLIANFKKLIPNCKTKYFNDDGSEKIWYGKNKNGNLEFFTFYGKHPETGKTLKPITEYMIRKYICKEY